MRKAKTKGLSFFGVLFLALAVTNAIGGTSSTNNKHVTSQNHLSKKVRHELVMLPYFGPFDNLQFQIKNPETVILSGQVTKPTLKSDAEHAVKQLEGIENVVNRIEVLPVSPSDDRIRVATYRAIYSRPGLERYGIQPNPPIHIIVKNGTVTLVGVVANKFDRDLAFMAANGVSGVFSVKSDLRIEKHS